jgi:hypothetical protein
MNVDCSIQMMNGCAYKDNWDFEANEFKEIHDYITNAIQNDNYSKICVLETKLLNLTLNFGHV